MFFFNFKKRSFFMTLGSVADAKKVAILHRACFPKPWDSTTIAGLLEHDHTKVVLAYPEGRGTDNPVGFAIYRAVANEAEIIAIGSDPAWRRYGIGRGLMVEAINRVHAERVERLFLEVSEFNEAAVELYQSLGFKTVGTRRGYYQDVPDGASSVATPKANALVMELQLG